MEQYRVLIVEDDLVIARGVAETLARWGLAARIVEDFRRVDAAFDAYDPQLVLMDVSLPFYNGYYWCRELRARSKAPILFLSSRAENADVVMAVDMGADDYLMKPIDPDVLIAKVRAALRRCYNYTVAAPRLSLRGALLDAAAACLISGDERIELTRNEMKILTLLIERKGQIVSRDEIMLKLWDGDAFVDENTLTVNVNRLRRKLDAAGLAGAIETRKGQGYALVE